MTTALASSHLRQRTRGSASMLGILLMAALSSDPAAAPTITAGSGVPDAAEPNGSIYCRTNGTIYLRQADAWSALTGSSLTTVIGAAATTKTIAAGSIAITQLSHKVDTEAAAASDDLDSITGGSAEQLLLVRAANAARTVVLKHAIGANKISTPGAADISLAEATDWALLAHNGTQWGVVATSVLAGVPGLIIGTNVQAYSAVLAALATAGLDQEVLATCAGADAAGGLTTALVSVQLKRRDNATSIASARQVLLLAGASQYQGDAPPPNASLSLGTVTAGSIVATIAAGCWLIETDATGLFACTATNTDDETVYWSVSGATGGVSNLTKACAVLGSNSDSSTWSA